MDLHEKRQLDLSEHVARVNQQVVKAKAHARPWRAIIAAALAIIAGAVASQADVDVKDWTGHGHYVYKIVAAGCIAVFFICGTIAVFGLAGKARDVLATAVGSSHAAVVRYAILLTGELSVLILGVGLMKVPIGQLLVGGAVTTILLGIAGQQSLSNIFAGLVLLLSRPFMVGDYIRLKSGALGGVTDGLVAEIGITYLRLDTEDGTLHLPNSQVLAAAVGPIAPPRPREPEPGPQDRLPALEPAQPDQNGPPYGGPPAGSP